MPCFRPLDGWRAKTPNRSTGRRGVVFNANDAQLDEPITVPCGQCVGCRLERSRQWAIRCVHEASLHDRNCFITLTYNDEHLPADGSLDLDEFQRFMKRLRKKFGEGIRFFHCGEYGERFQRPHYHACLFNFDFDDKELWSVRDGVRLYRSKELEDLWSDGFGNPIGFATVGEVTFESAAYVARYIMKKVTGDDADAHYEGRKPEYVTMSRRPGLGKGWFERYKSDVYPFDRVILRGQKMRPPRYYDGLLEIDSPEEFDKLKASRKANAIEHVDEQRSSRLIVREQCAIERLKLLKRSFENG